MTHTVSLRQEFITDREWLTETYFLDGKEITREQWHKIHYEIEKCRGYPCKYSSLDLADKIDEILSGSEK